MPTVRDYTALLSGDSIHGTTDTGAFYTFSFPVSVPLHHFDEFSSDGLSTFRPFTEVEKDVAREAIAAFAEACGLTFFEVSPGDGDILFCVYDLEALGEDDGVSGFGYYPRTYDSAIASDIFVERRYADELHTLLHEIGHAIGLKHPFSGEIELADSLDNWRHTVMSYDDGGSDGEELGDLDIDALEYLYGNAAADGDQVASWGWNPATFTLTQEGFSTADAIFGVGSADIIRGMGGNDSLRGRGGRDRLEGGDGNDWLDGGRGNDVMLGGAGGDNALGGDDSDRIDGGTGNDDLWGEAGDDTLLGGSGHDTLTGDDGTDRLEGGDGEDTGWGGFGNDSLYGGAANDILIGESGHDLLNGGTGSDRMDGGPGNDIYFVDSWTPSSPTSGDGVNELSGSAYGSADTVRASVSYALPANVENLILLGTASISGSGNAAANAVTGNAAANGLAGFGGNDTLKSGGGADRVHGGTGSDKIYGGTGNDLLRGDDTAGNHGRDRFYFDTTPNASSNWDRIEDFNPADDFIHLARSVFTRLGAAGTLAADAFHIIGFGAADREDRILYNPANGALCYDPDGNTPGGVAPILFAALAPGLAISHTDFIVF